MGPLLLGDLQSGKWRDLTEGEVRALHDETLAATGPSATVAPAASGRRGAGLRAGSRAAVKPRTRITPRMIAIDGPSASGKSTIGGLLARQLDYLYFDTGVMYRAVAATALARGVAVSDEAAITALAQQMHIQVTPSTVDDGRDVTVLVDGHDVTDDLRRREVEKAVSPVSAYPGVREAMRIQQRRIGEQGRVIMVGRDIGTVVLPDADLKIYLDAAPTERARRRHAERRARG